MRFLGASSPTHGAVPKYIVCDRDSIFDCDAFRRWVKRKGIKPPRYGAVGKHGSIAMIERLILTTKQLLRLLPLIPLRRESLRRELVTIFDWYNEHRPHTGLAGKTPNEVYRRCDPPIVAHASNHAIVGRVDHRVPGPVHLSPASQVIGSRCVSTSTLVDDTCRS